VLGTFVTEKAIVQKRYNAIKTTNLGLL